MPETTDALIEVPIDRQQALVEAERRFRRLPEILASAKRTDNEALESCIAEAVELVKGEARPMGLYGPRTARREGRVLRLGRARISNRSLVDRITDGQRVLVYLVTVGYTNVKMFEAVQRDYVAYHFQHYMSRQLLYAAGNLLDKAIRGREGGGFQRYAILEDRTPEPGATDEKTDGTHLYWDTGALADIFEVFAHNPLGVRLTSTRNLNPIYSLLGVMVPKRPRVEVEIEGT